MSLAKDGSPSPFGSHPPKPVLTLRIGVSGHRPKPEKFPETSFEFVKRRLGTVFAAIDKCLETLKEENKKYYATDTHKVRLVSGLAEGADQLAIEMRPADWNLDAILPLPLENYRLDFHESATGAEINVLDQFEDSLRAAATVLQLPDDPRILTHQPASEHDRDQFLKIRSYAYARDLDVFIRQFDILIGVWDGKPEDGPGGTAEVIRRALDSSIPVVWISSLADTFPRLVEEIEEDGQPIAPPADCLRGSLQEAISNIVSAPFEQPRSNAASEASGLTVEQRLAIFLNETWPGRTSWTTYDRFKRWAEGRPRRAPTLADPIEYEKASWAKFIGDAPPAGKLGDRLLEILMPRYAWADALAVDLSHRFRSAYIKAYLMAALAVFIALIGFFGHDLPIPITQILVTKSVLITLEFYFIYRILMIVRMGRKARWQERWVEYRALAEILRDLRFLAYFGEYGYAQRPDDFAPSSAAWFLWYLRATIREIGLPNAVLDGAYQRAHLVAVENDVLHEQIKYHEINVKTLYRMHRFLYVIGENCFLLTLVLLSIFLLAHLCFIAVTQVTAASETGVAHVLYVLGDPVTLLVACLPAVGAAVAGIRETGDFEGFAQRSSKTLAELQDLTREFETAKRRLRLDTTGAVLVATARVLTADLTAWQAIYGRKRLNLPT
jgi:hypothetical protein